MCDSGKLKVTSFKVHPSDAGLPLAKPEDLVGGSPEDSAFAVWEIATRVWCVPRDGVPACVLPADTADTAAATRSTRLRSGSLGARVLRWSPKGSYLVVAGFDASSFEIWETHTWCAAARAAAAPRLRR